MIKKKLKELGITLAYFAESLSISRPTLDTYIDCFERKEKIPKDKIQIIFERLFSEDIKTKEEFEANLKQYKNLLERDKLLGTFELNAKNTDLMTSVIDNIKEDMYSNDFNENIYIYINMILKSYKREPIFRYIADYFLALNSRLDIKDLDKEQKIFISNFYKICDEYKKDMLLIDEVYFKKFKNRIEEIEKDKKEAKTMLNEKIKTLINNEIEEQLKLGFDINDIELEDIIDKIIIKK